MRRRSFQTTLTAVALVLATAPVAIAQDIDIFADDPPAKASVQSTPAAAPQPQPAVKKASVDQTPTGSLGRPDEAPTTTSPAPVAPAPVTAQKAADPDVDGVTKPATPAPSKDPLDAPPASSAPAAPKPAPTPAATATPDKPAAGAPDAAKPAAAAMPVQPAPLTVTAPLAPLDAAIKAALDKRDATEIHGAQAAERRKERAAVAAYYEAHGYAPTWSENGAPVAAVESVLARLAKSSDDALSLPAVPTKLAVTGSPDEIAASEIALTDAVVAYARQASGSRVDPRLISPLIGARPELADPAEIVDTIAAADAAAGDRLAALNPSDPRYAALRDKLVQARAARATGGMPIAPGPTLKIGMHDPRVPQLRARFGLIASDLLGDEDEYDMSLAEAVSAFQRANGLPVSGLLTKHTVAALAGGARPSSTEGLIEANMEMWRWMPRDLGRNRIEVDVTAFVVTVFHDGEPVASNRVVVGKPDTPTPIFSNTMRYLIVNPVWNVPDSIIKKEFLPKGEGYLESHGFDVSYHHGRLVVKQPSGAKNALGQIKFMFPNDYSVYLHDTPSKSLFAASKRAFSHGCVRVDHPFDFAFDVLNDSVPEGGRVRWSEKRIDSLIGDSERYVNLPEPLPIHIEYFTASVDPETSRLVQREDIYGYARDVAVALGAEGAPTLLSERRPHRTAKTAIAADEDPR